jgi:hypothetical protein
MQVVAPGVAFVGTVLRPKGTKNPSPRDYVDVGRSINAVDAKVLQRLLSQVCKHVSIVRPCNQTPSGLSASFYVSYGGLDPDGRSTMERITRYRDALTKVISDCYSDR